MPRGDLLGSLEHIILLAVLHLEANAYGMTIRREIEKRTGRNISIGAVYATLDRLEAKKLVASSRDDVDGVSRRVFRILPAGVKALAESKAMRERLWRGVDLRAITS